ncbi:hypothetical protein LTR85_000989 [Meristemomyces frigidus]|nr:hypothetical protein LTR85_000989 [Meristemomyces frigidus]
MSAAAVARPNIGDHREPKPLPASVVKASILAESATAADTGATEAVVSKDVSAHPILGRATQVAPGGLSKHDESTEPSQTSAEASNNVGARSAPVIGGHRPTPQAWTEGTKPGQQPADDSNGGQGDGSSNATLTPEQAKVQGGTGVASAILNSRPFLIKTCLLGPGTAEAPAATVEWTGSIHSKSLDDSVPKFLPSRGVDASFLSLQTIRKLIPAMSRFGHIHKFCTQSGLVLEDESLRLGDYLAIEPEGESGAAAGAVASVTMYYRSPAANPVSALTGGGSDQAHAPSINTELSKQEGGLKAEIQSAQLQSLIDKTGVQKSTGAVISAGTLTEAQWGVVLRNCAVFFGWVVDPQTKAIRRAPKAAFQLRSRPDSSGGEVGIADYEPNVGSDDPPSHGTTQATEQPPAAVPVTASVANAGSTGPIARPALPTVTTASSAVQQADAQAKSFMADTNTRPLPANVQQADTVASNFNAQNATAQAATPSSTRLDAEILGPDGELELPSERQARYAKEEAAKDAARNRYKASTLKTSTSGIPTKMYSAIPNFRVNDDSKIDIAVCKHELATSMAKNDFSSQSTEASVSGGAMGITVGVSAGYASSQSSGHEQSSTEATQTMVARYMYPRCDLFLTPGDLEPTPEFAALLEQIRTSKSIRTLRRLQSDFGQLFCQQLTLGARLLSTQTMSSRFTGTTDQQKEQFKVSVGVSVSTPYGGASVKHEQEKGSSNESKSSETNSNESNVFEAVGGDTILANNPNAWATTVSSPDTWRVINRDGLSSLVEMVSQMPGYEPVQSWFVQAVPALSKYMTLDASHTVTCRFKVQSPTNALHVRNENGKARHYLGFGGDVVSPCMNSTDTTVINGICPFFWIRVDATVEKRLFEPWTYRAPVIHGFDDYDVDGTKFGAKFSDSFAAVTWDVIAPFTDVLSNGSRVIFRTKPTDPKTSPSHMVVFRTAQGEFVPGMSDSDQYQYWRLLKTGSTQPGEPIKAGDEVQLCWSFKDQTTGYRDYVEDTFGRRQTLPPSGSTDVLYLKVPWPRFENTGHPTAMIMSSDVSAGETVTDVVTAHGTFKYALQDLRFRLDVVENSGHGDAEDYLLQGVSQEGDKIVSANVSIRLAGDPLRMMQTIAGFGVSRTF